MKKLISFFYQNQPKLITFVSYTIATCLFVLATLLYSSNVNKRAMMLKQELKIKESELASFVGNIFTTSNISNQSPLNCKELIKAKFDIINVMNSAITKIPRETGDKLLNFEDEVFKYKNACTKEFYDRAALKRISDKIIDELKKDIRNHKKKLKSLTSSLFYTNQG